jgi:barstar (barnase inhibitor)
MSIKIETKAPWDLYSELYARVCADSVERILFVRGWKMSTKQSLMDECAAALQFPPLRAENWDAFSEDIFSLEWICKSRKILLILETEKVLQHADDRDRLIFFRVLLDAPAEHAAESSNDANLKSELEIILQCDEECRQQIEQLLVNAKAGQNA